MNNAPADMITAEAMAVDMVVEEDTTTVVVMVAPEGAMEVDTEVEEDMAAEEDTAVVEGDMVAEEDMAVVLTVAEEDATMLPERTSLVSMVT